MDSKIKYIVTQDSTQRKKENFRILWIAKTSFGVSSLIFIEDFPLMSCYAYTYSYYCIARAKDSRARGLP